MAFLDICEYAALGDSGNSRSVARGQEPGLSYQQLAITGASVPSVAFSARTQLIRVHADAACRVTFGASPTAAPGASLRLNAGSTEYFNVTPGHKVAVISSN